MATVEAVPGRAAVQFAVLKTKTLKETRRANDAALNFYAVTFGKGPTFPVEPAPAAKQRANSDIPSESKEQVAFVKWFRLQFPSVRIFAIPNGGARDAITGSRLKAEGVEPGVPDLYIPKWHLWIEMKRIKKSSTSEEQKGWAAYLVDECGDRHLFAFGAADAIEKIKEFINAR